MSVIVKGMEMPENCGKCPFLIEEDIDFDICRQCGAGKSGYIYEKDIDGFPSDCPLIALPDKHGRLVDAGECAEYFWEHLDDNGMAGAMNAINDMPTIVEAEDNNG